uniref:Uncharacterized protein n=1 Tax=viral metagenome TaxID=1070528 RepID=A0A6C0I2V3_9ZZZZ
MLIFILLIILLILLAILISINIKGRLYKEVNNIYGGAQLFSSSISHIHIHSGRRSITYTNAYIQSKLIPKELDNNSSNAFFVLEKLSSDNINFWTAHATKNKDSFSNAERDPIIIKTRDTQLSDTDTYIIPEYEYVDSFINSLILFNKMRLPEYLEEEKYDIFIGYITNKNPFNENIDSESIEICVSIMAKDTIPIISLIGYFKSYSYYRLSYYITHSHKNIYLYLTMFSVSILKLLYPSILYIVTKMPKYIHLILVNNRFRSDNESYDMYIGSIYDRNKIMQLLESTNNQQLIESETNTFHPSYKKDGTEQISITIDDSSTIWKLADIEINCPPWFLFKHTKNISHPQLANDYDNNNISVYPTIIIDINFLKKLWDGLLTKIEPFRLYGREGYIQMQLLEREYSPREYSEVQFVFEKLGDHNYEFWKKYSKANIEPASTVVHPISRQYININDAVPAFNEGIVLYDKMAKHKLECRRLRIAPSDNIYDIWIAYIYHKNILDSSRLDSNDIEISFLVAAKEGIPVTSHMGIFKNIKCFDIQGYGARRWKLISHKGVSIPLHIFAMASSRLAYPDAQFMITRPVSIMTSILLHKIPEDHIWVGTTIDRYRTLTYIKEELLKNKTEFIPKITKDIIVSEIMHKIKEEIKKREKNIPYDKKYTDIDKEILIDLIYRQTIIEELEFLYTDKEQLNADIFSQYYSKLGLRLDANQYLYKPPIDNLQSDIAPIDDIDINWKLTKKDGTIIEFKCPGWYLTDSNTIGEMYFSHINLNNNYLNLFDGDKLLNVIVDIDLAVDESEIPLLDYI